MFRSLGSLIALAFTSLSTVNARNAEAPTLKLRWKENFLTVYGDHFPGEEMQVHYLEAYCRDKSSDADWQGHTKLTHRTQLLHTSADETAIKLKCFVDDGLEVTHEIRSTFDEVDFRILAHNPTDKRSEAHWAQPCIRVDKFHRGRSGDLSCEKFHLP